MKLFPEISRLGERAILIQFESEINEEVLQKVLATQKMLQDKLVKSSVEVTNTYNSLLVIYPSTIEDAYSEVLELRDEISKVKLRYKFKTWMFHIPVCYDDSFAPDLDEISKAKGIQKSEIIKLHSSSQYTVYFTGFLPGFLYLGGLPESLHFPRRKQPRLEVPKGAVGIGEKQTGIYPQKSPGGWHIIGNSPVPLFDPFSNPPCEIKAGDKILFYEVSLKEHQEIVEEVQKGVFAFKRVEHGG